MTELEAQSLYEAIGDEIKQKKRIWRKVIQLGNGEYVVRINGDIFIWSKGDWDAIKHKWRQHLVPSAIRVSV